MTFEAVFMLLLLALAISALALFNFQKHDSQEFYLCSDAAVLLAKSGDFSSQADIEDKVLQLSQLSGMCVSVDKGQLQTPICALAQGAEKISFEIPVWDGLRVSKARVSCFYSS